MRERKKLLEERSDAFVVAPGGIGTFDEFFEILTLKQLGRHNKPIAIFSVDGCYDPLIALLHHTVKGRFMNETSLALFAVFTEVGPLIDYLEGYSAQEREVSFFKEVGENDTKD